MSTQTALVGNQVLEIKRSIAARVDELYRQNGNPESVDEKLAIVTSQPELNLFYMGLLETIKEKEMHLFMLERAYFSRNHT